MSNAAALAMEVAKLGQAVISLADRLRKLEAVAEIAKELCEHGVIADATGMWLVERLEWALRELEEEASSRRGSGA